jgi:hypothetical protein
MEVRYNRRILFPSPFAEFNIDETTDSDDSSHSSITMSAKPKKGRKKLTNAEEATVSAAATILGVKVKHLIAASEYSRALLENSDEDDDVAEEDGCEDDHGNLNEGFDDVTANWPPIVADETQNERPNQNESGRLSEVDIVKVSGFLDDPTTLNLDSYEDFYPTTQPTSQTASETERPELGWHMIPQGFGIEGQIEHDSMHPQSIHSNSSSSSLVYSGFHDGDLSIGAYSTTAGLQRQEHWPHQPYEFEGPVESDERTGRDFYNEVLIEHGANTSTDTRVSEARHPDSHFTKLRRKVMPEMRTDSVPTPAEGARSIRSHTLGDDAKLSMRPFNQPVIGTPLASGNIAIEAPHLDQLDDIHKNDVHVSMINQPPPPPPKHVTTLSGQLTRLGTNMNCKKRRRQPQPGHEDSGKPAAKRRGPLDPDKRMEAAKTRERGACLRCHDQKIKVCY